MVVRWSNWARILAALPPWSVVVWRPVAWKRWSAEKSEPASAVRPSLRAGCGFATEPSPDPGKELMASQLQRMRTDALWVMGWSESRPHGFFTCDLCQHRARCNSVYDSYNTDGWCLANSVGEALQFLSDADMPHMPGAAASESRDS